MDRFMKRVGIPLLLMLGGGLTVRFLNEFLSGDVRRSVISFVTMIFLFGFGLCLNVHKKRRDSAWLRKLIIAFVLLFFLLWDMGLVSMFSQLEAIMAFFGVQGFVMHMIYIYCGWAFFE